MSESRFQNQAKKRDLHRSEVEEKWAPTNLHSSPEQRIVESAICLAGFEVLWITGVPGLQTGPYPAQTFVQRMSMQKLVFPEPHTKDSKINAGSHSMNIQIIKINNQLSKTNKNVA